MKRLLHAFWMCQSMFCAIPCPCKTWDEEARYALLWCLPLVGLELGFIWWISGLLCLFFGLHQLIVGLVLCAVPYFATGFLHLDGFMDVTDAVGSCRDLARRREILKDSHVGSFAVIGCVLLILCQFVFACAAADSADLRLLIVIPVVSRCCSSVAVAVLPKMATSQYARKKAGLADILIPGAFLVASFALSLWVGPRGALVLIAELAGYGLALRKGYASLEGMNGDISGYALTLGELTALGALAVL